MSLNLRPPPPDKDGFVATNNAKETSVTPQGRLNLVVLASAEKSAAQSVVDEEGLVRSCEGNID